MVSPKKLIRAIAKILVIGLAVMLAVGFLVLKWMERSPAQLKVGLESYLTQVSGYPADIGRINKISFVPHMMVDMDDVRLWALDDPDRTMIGAQSAIIRMPFWSVMLGMPRFSAFAVEGVMLDEAVSGIAPMRFERIYIDAQASSLKIEGDIGGLAVNGSVPLDRSGPNFIPQSQATRMTLSVEGAGSQGDIFIDLNKDGYGVTADFTRYAARDIRPVQKLLERFAQGRGAAGALPARLRIDMLEGVSGPFDVPAISFEGGALQPLECFYNNRERAGAKPHPCLTYFEGSVKDD